MSRSSSRAGLVPATAVFPGILFMHAASSAEPAATWDHASVTGIAKKLATLVGKLDSQEYKAPEPEGMGNERPHQEFMDDLRRLQHETRHLADSLAKGASEKATLGSVKHIREINDDLAEYAREMAFVNPVTNQFVAFEDLIRQLESYYGLERKQ